jgi:prepilin-type N-terminal cleavage/methylation domain-containing protein
MPAYNNTEKRPRAGHPGERGFSLIEILIAISILSVGLLALAQMQVFAMHQNSKINTRNQAIGIAQDRIELVVATDYQNINTLSGTLVVPEHEYGTAYTIVTTVNDHPASRYADVEVKVTWYENYQPKSFSLVMLKSDAEG